VAALWQALGLRQELCCELVDFYHVVEHLYKLAGLKRKSTTRKRRQWVKRWRRGLLKEKPKQVLEEIKKCTSGRIGKELRRERNYFLRNARAGRLNYAAARLGFLPSILLSHHRRRAALLELLHPAILCGSRQPFLKAELID